MTHQKPPTDSLHVWRVPIPTDPALESEYRSLGWIQSGQELMWSFAKGTPMHPGDHLDGAGWNDTWGMTPTLSLLQVLPVPILAEGLARLPEAASCEEAYLEVPVVVTISYRRMSNNRGKNSSSFWSADDARLIALAAESPQE